MSNSIAQAMKEAQNACQTRTNQFVAELLKPKPVRRSARLAAKRITAPTATKPEAKAKKPWSTEDVQYIQTLSTFPTYRDLFRKYNFPISFINHERGHLTLDSSVTPTMQGTDYATAIRTYCFLMRSRTAMNSSLMIRMLTDMGLKDCATYAEANTTTDRPSYDISTHGLQFECTQFDVKGIALFAKAPDYNVVEVKEARKTPLSPLRKSSFITIMRVILDKMDILVANKAKYSSEKEYMDAKVQCTQNLYNQLLSMQDVLVGEDSLRRFTLTSETKAFQIIQEICEHPEINPVLAAETLYVLRSYIVMTRALMKALED